MNDVAYYMKLPYLVEVRPAEGGGFYARYPELVTPHGDGPTVADAVREADVSKELFFESCLEHGDPIPEPDEIKTTAATLWCAPRPACTATSRSAPELKVSASTSWS